MLIANDASVAAASTASEAIQEQLIIRVEVAVETTSPNLAYICEGTMISWSGVLDERSFHRILLSTRLTQKPSGGLIRCIDIVTLEAIDFQVPVAVGLAWLTVVVC